MSPDLSGGIFACRITIYPVRYEFPTIDSIKEVLNCVRVYYESLSPQIIANTQKG